ncbi:MAG TPA: glycosyltransferase family 4 protein [Thermodesulfobacteriota bacterium]|nr:glycosyltransferase family 4 protein [Thermodesulfobacteriota bacterium]
MKILYFTHRGQLLTGSGTYRDILLHEMGKRHDIGIYSTPEDLKEEWDIGHVLDLKHANPKCWQDVSFPVLVDIHDYYWTKFHYFPCPDLPLRFVLQKIRKWRYTKILSRAQAIIVHSEYVKNTICHPNIFVVRLAIDPNNYTRPSNQQDKNLILFVGRDYFRKGLPTLIKALPLVLKEIPDVRVVVIGPEYLHSRLAAKFITGNLPVKFINGLPPEEIKKYFYQANLLVLPSEIEASGIVLLEAMAAGLPIVATRVGGIPEIIQDGINGILVERGDNRQLARSIIEVLRNKIIRDQRNHPNWEDMFNPAKMVESIESVYQQIRESLNAVKNKH